MIGHRRTRRERARHDQEYRCRSGHESAQGFEVAAATEHGVAGNSNQRNNPQGRVQGIDRTTPIHDREEDQVDELENRSALQRTRRPSDPAVSRRAPPRLRQKQQAGGQVAGCTENKRNPKYFTHG